MTVAAKIIVKQLIQSRNCIRRTLFRNSRCFRFFLEFLMLLNIRHRSAVHGDHTVKFTLKRGSITEPKIHIGLALGKMDLIGTVL